MTKSECLQYIQDAPNEEMADIFRTAVGEAIGKGVLEGCVEALDEDDYNTLSEALSDEP